MSFKLGDIIVKDILYGLASNISTGDPLYVLTQLSEAQISVTAESTDVTDKDGNIVLRNFRSKQGEFTATNAFLNGNVIAASGATTDIASQGNALIAPKIIKVKASDGSAVLSNVVDGSITVSQYFGDGNLGKNYTLGLTASDTEFAITTGSTTIYTFNDVSATYIVAADQTAFPAVGDATKTYIDVANASAYVWDSTNSQYDPVSSAVISIVTALPDVGDETTTYVNTTDNKVYTCTITVTPDGTTTVTLPTDPEADYFMIKYQRTFISGAIITNSAKQFPSSVNMLLKVLYYDPCSKDEIKAAYVEMPSFKISPEQTISFNPESPTMDINATLEIDYCSDDKELFRIYFVDEIDAA